MSIAESNFMTKKSSPKQPRPLTPSTTGVYVLSVDEDTYEGPYLQKLDFFTSTAKASAYIGCSYDQIGAFFRYSKKRGWGGVAPGSKG
jgi:hypothetical protein